MSSWKDRKEIVMPLIQIYFGRRYHPVSYGIRWVTRSHFSHVELQIAENSPKI